MWRRGQADSSLAARLWTQAVLPWHEAWNWAARLAETRHDFHDQIHEMVALVWQAYLHAPNTIEQGGRRQFVHMTAQIITQAGLAAYEADRSDEALDWCKKAWSILDKEVPQDRSPDPDLRDLNKTLAYVVTDIEWRILPAREKARKARGKKGRRSGLFGQRRRI